MNYKPFTDQEVIKYVYDNTNIFENINLLSCEEIGDGNLNLVFRIRDKKNKKSVIVKQALDYLRVAGDNWPLTRQRVKFESECLKIENDLTNGMCPKIYKYDTNMCCIVMEDLVDYEIMRKGLISGKKYNHFANNLSTFLSEVLFKTSDIFMNPVEKKKLMMNFINPELCKITEDLVFTDPYYDSESNNVNPELRDYLENYFWKNNELITNVEIMKEKFMTHSQSLIHGDLHTGSIFINDKDLKIFDAEFAFYGPSSFDIGAVIANLLLNYISWGGKDVSKEFRNDFRNYLKNSIIELWNLFEFKFKKLWDEKANKYYKSKEFRDIYVENLFHDSIGFSSCKMMRRCVGLAHVEDIDEIRDLKKRANVQKLVLKIGEFLIINRNDIESIEKLMSIIEELTSKYEII
ncbi:MULTISPECIES: S-methyl-5-thioribose kinase [Oceanotoga]|jgi:5-methylthioribose kinase|uniref:5'-methylthioribose kinase n=1 Tax=Oceanotoga teriensis TaxID=515440 RepID=A0AA45HHQ6_9BACT|nr:MULTISPECIES: S-methyl-5-thioribose kinase [Oceanotoga]MDN5342758.1 5-methylthioribose kinase [Oceanotoga sp.]MDO7975782.1 S-methyl-5-thioribose kinase [Oceanotoga teriensis]PWJ88063.1 5'-methylthioribose kinase [Oceanotoga teriensis]